MQTKQSSPPSSSVFLFSCFLTNFHILATNKKAVYKAKFFLGGEKWPKINHIMRILIFFKLPYLDNTFQNIAKKIQHDSYTFLLSSLTCRQIWQSLLVDHHQPTHLKNVGKFLFLFLKKTTTPPSLKERGRYFRLAPIA